MTYPLQCITISSEGNVVKYFAAFSSSVVGRSERIQYVSN